MMYKFFLKLKYNKLPAFIYILKQDFKFRFKKNYKYIQH